MNRTARRIAERNAAKTERRCRKSRRAARRRDQALFGLGDVAPAPTIAITKPTPTVAPTPTDPWSDTRARLAKAIGELTKHEWKIDDADEAIIDTWVGLPGEPPTEEVLRAVASGFDMVSYDEGCDWWLDLEQILADLDSTPEEMESRQEMGKDDEERARAILLPLNAAGLILHDYVDRIEAGPGRGDDDDDDPLCGLAASFEELSAETFKTGRLQDALTGLLRLAGATLGIADGYRHRLGLGELEPLRQRWRANLLDAFSQGYAYSLWSSDFLLGHTLFADDKSEQAIADRVAGMIGEIADGVDVLYSEINPPCPRA